MANKVHGFGSGICVRELALGEVADFVDSGWIQVAASRLQQSELFEIEGDLGGWIDDSVGARRKRVDGSTRFAVLSAAAPPLEAVFCDENGCCSDGAWRRRWHESWRRRWH